MTQARDRESRNIVILGSLGVGKSSLVNMLIGGTVAPVSSGIGVAHSAIMEYPISFNEISPHHGPELMLRFYDTLGLEHRPSPLGLIQARLERSGGVDLVVYCIRRGRLSDEQVKHLRTIWRTFCRGDVPLVLVVSGVEYRRGSIEHWWEENGEDLINATQVTFSDHICLPVDTWDPARPSWKHQHQGASYEDSQRLVRDLVIRHCRGLCFVP